MLGFEWLHNMLCSNGYNINYNVVAERIKTDEDALDISFKQLKVDVM